MAAFDLSLIRTLTGESALPVYAFDTVDSTNTECRRRLSAGEARCLVLSDAQSAGRGRRGRSFFSPAGAGLYMSLAFRPEGGPAAAVGVTTFAAVCAAEAVEVLTGLRCGIKWVNDLYLDGKKVCGILTEAIGEAVVVGIGVNLTPAAVPEELQSIVGCLGREGIRDKLAGEIARRLLLYRSGDKGHMAEYRRRSVVLGRRVRFGERAGLAAAIGDDGALAVDTEDGRVLLRAGEISLEEIEGLRG